MSRCQHPARCHKVLHVYSKSHGKGCKNIHDCLFAGDVDAKASKLELAIDEELTHDAIKTKLISKVPAAVQE